MSVFPYPVTLPLINPNEPEATLADLYIVEGQRVEAGQTLCTLETTKSAAEVVAEASGYVAGLRSERGQLVSAGEVLCFLAETPGWQPPESPAAGTKPDNFLQPSGLRISQPALALVKTYSLDLDSLPRNRFITESIVRNQIQRLLDPGNKRVDAEYGEDAILVYGGGGHGKSCIDLLRSLGGYNMVGVVDDGLPPGTTIMGLSVLGGGEVLAGLKSRGLSRAVNAVGGIGNISIRMKVFERLAQTGFTCPAVVHPTAFVEQSAALSDGVQVFPHAYIGSEVTVGYGAIVNTGAIVSHDCNLGEYANISPGAMLAGGVRVGRAALVGMGVTIHLNVEIGEGARIGNSAVVKTNVPANAVVRAGKIYPE